MKIYLLIWVLITLDTKSNDQTTINTCRYEGKENSMEFLNSFLEEETGSMRRFLWRISSPPGGPDDDGSGWIPQVLSYGHFPKSILS